VLKTAFPMAKLSGYDISSASVDHCRKKYAVLADFYTGAIENVPNMDVIIASHVMEHISDDKSFIRKLLDRTEHLFVFVPYKESPLYFEHVNYYDESYYNDFNQVDYKVFKVSYDARNSLSTVIKQGLKGRLALFTNVTDPVIMFHLHNQRL
jgi:hypothetical protein